MTHLHRLAALACTVSAVRAGVTTSVDVLGPGEGTQPPPGIVIIDILIDVTPGDEWTAGGLRGQATNGAELIYFTDPDDGSFRLVNPGSANRFVTSFSRPRARDGSGRFDNAQAFVAGGYCPSLPPPGEISGSRINVAWASVPSGTGVDGAVGRIALRLAHPCDGSGQSFEIHVPGQEPPGRTPIFLVDWCGSAGGLVSASVQQSTPTGLSWGVYSTSWPPHWCAADLDCDAVVGLSDLAVLLSSFGECWPDAGFDARADLVRDDCVDLDDLAVLLTEFGARDYPFLDCN